MLVVVASPPHLAELHGGVFLEVGYCSVIKGHGLYWVLAKADCWAEITVQVVKGTRLVVVGLVKEGAEKIEEC